MTGRLLLGLAFAGFVALGMPESALGVAWPSISDRFGRSLGELGLLLAVYTGGYLLSTATTGRLLARFGLGPLLVASSSLTASALTGVALTGWWPLLVAAAVLLGFGGGLIDAGVNAYVAVHHDARAMNLLHAAFGVGATLGPLLLAATIAASGSWRAGYGALAAVQLLLTAAFWRTRHRWTGGTASGGGSRRRRPVLIPGLVVFFLYTGVEVGTGQWAFTLLTESRGLGTAAAGALVTGYWGSFTVGRVAAAAAGSRGRAETYITAGTVLALLGIGCLWWNPAPWVGAAGLLIAGFSLAPIFPFLTLLTPARVGPDYAPTAIGYQLAAAALGAAAIPGAIGIAVDRTGLESIGPGLAIAAAVLVVAAAAVTRRRVD